ncbi:MarR family winged helix-turn-helix transcriptional regulator [Ferroacidibacillus organovorans]|uniref:HTH marR-type domain-containing protein n=1 Tax=Ferroacidibacillus organovorans TaxID=1765683 RepID=A0A124IW97_9BACL|nr:MarR family transcriptional regulator [Ferroacidibacillus organovorans]KUO96696.1 hypothetical protein ATW55_07675 [Ferroacidibacillus organovorans]
MTFQDESNVFEIERLLRAIAGTVRKKGRSILINFDITIPQFDALVYAFECGNVTIGDLSAKLGLAYSTTTDLVDRLALRGYVMRVRDDEDKRVVRVRVQDEGERLIDEVLRARRAYLSGVLEKLSDTEQLHLKSVLQLLERHLI